LAAINALSGNFDKITTQKVLIIKLDKEKEAFLAQR